LAVGDVFFRQKCYQRLEQLVDEGVSIVLVSHNMPEVEQFCQNVILLEKGQVDFLGQSTKGVRKYYLLEQRHQSSHIENSAAELIGTAELSQKSRLDSSWPVSQVLPDTLSSLQIGNGWARCLSVALCDDKGQPCRAFQQGQQASFYYEFELLHDIGVPIGGIVIQNEKGIIVHGKNTLEYGSEVPSSVLQGDRIRFRQDIKMEIATGEYTFEVGLAAICYKDYVNCGSLMHHDLKSKIVRICHIPSVAQFSILFRHEAKPVQLLHHGLANLPGGCEVFLKRKRL
jgi:hypothetical protein